MAKNKTPMSNYAKSVHKKFIPANIVIIVISLIAAICQLFMPCIDLRIQITGSSVSTMIQESFSEEQKETLGDTLTHTLGEINFDIPINLYPMKMLKAATGNQADVEAFFNSIIGDNGTAKLLDDMIDKLAPSLLTTGIVAIISEQGVSPEIAQKYKENADVVLKNLNDGNEAAAKEEFSNIANSIAEEQGTTISQEDIDELFDAFVEKGKNPDGTFDTTTLIKNFDMSMLSGNFNKEEETFPPDAEGTSVRLTAQAEGENQDDVTNESSVDDTTGSSLITGLVELMENPAHFVLETVGGDDVQSILDTLQPALLAIFFVLAGIPAIFWALLALCATIRLFTPKKRVRMWYVKLFCFFPGLLVLLVNVGVKVIMNLLSGSQAGALLSAVSIKFLGSGVVTGCCYVALVLVSLFWYRRLRKKAKLAASGLYDDSFSETKLTKDNLSEEGGSDVDNEE